MFTCPAAYSLLTYASPYTQPKTYFILILSSTDGNRGVQTWPVDEICALVAL